MATSLRLERSEKKPGEVGPGLVGFGMFWGFWKSGAFIWGFG